MQFEPYLTDSQTMCIKLDVSDIDGEIGEVFHINKDLFIFKINTYVKLKSKKQGNGGWDTVFAAINAFIATLSKEDKIELAVCLAMMHDKIITWFANSDGNMIQVNCMLKEVGHLLNVLDDNIGLCAKLREYVVNNIPIGLFENAGKRAQDSAEFTFWPEEVVDLMTLTMLCKLMCPIFSILMHYLSRHVDTKSKEILVMTVFSELLNTKYKVLIEKLDKYIKHTTEQTVDKSLSSLMHGYNQYSLAFYLKCLLFVRQFVNVDLSIKDGNLMVYVIVSVKRAIKTVFTYINRQPTYTRKPVTTKHEDDGNTAQIEIDSMTSRKTCDIKALISVAVKDIKDYFALYDIDEEEYNKVVDYYERHPVTPTLINTILCSMFFSKYIGGGRSVAYLGCKMYARLVALLQMILLQLDVNYVALAHALTMQPAIDTPSSVINTGQFLLDIMSTDAYRNCKTYLEQTRFGADGKQFDQYMQEIVQQYLATSYVYNTAPYLWGWLEEDNKNGKLIEPNRITIVAICSFYSWLTETGQV